MAYSAATLSSLNGIHKQTHLPELEKVIPETDHIQRDFRFQEGQKIGRQFRQPVYLTMPHGFTFATSDSAPTLNATIAAQSQEATFDCYQMIGRERVSYDAADRIAAGGKSSYVTEVGTLMEWLRQSHTHKFEMLMFHGQDTTNGIGTVLSISGSVLTLTIAQFAPATWWGSENMKLDVYRSTTFLKTVAVTSYDLDNMTVAVDDGSGIAASDILFLSGTYGKDPPGLYKIASNSGSLYGISAATYNLWKGVNQTAGGGTLKFIHLLQAGAKARAKGMVGEVNVYINPYSMVDLVNEVEAARADPQRKGSAPSGTHIERGAEGFRVASPTTRMNIKVSDFVKKGFAFGVLMDGSMKRLGSSDVTFRYPGAGDGNDALIHMQDIAGYEFRSWSNQTLYTSRPGCVFYVNNIVNSIDGGT